jgi:hypothetical protein
MRKNNYVKVTKHGLRITLSTNAWVYLRLCVGYLVPDAADAQEEAQLRALLAKLPALPLASDRSRKGIRTRNGRKLSMVFPVAKVPTLQKAMTFAENVRAGFAEGPRTNIGSALTFLEGLDAITLLGALGNES